MTMFLILGRAGWNFVVNGRIFFCCFFFCFRANFLSLNLTSHVILSTNALGQPLAWRRVLNLFKLSLNNLSVELVLRSLSVSPLMKPFLTPGGWQEE